jgi:hypothetical protein
MSVCKPCSKEALIYRSFPCAMDGELANQAYMCLIQRE